MLPEVWPGLQQVVLVRLIMAFTIAKCAVAVALSPVSPILFIMHEANIAVHIAYRVHGLKYKSIHSTVA